MLLKKLRIVGHSMEPTLRNRDLVLVSGIQYLFKKPKLNDIVVFEEENKILIKRIIKATEKGFFVAGDNKKDSLDSRKLGIIPKNKIIGKIIYAF